MFKEAYSNRGRHGVTVLGEQPTLYFRGLKISRHVQEVQVGTFDSSVGIEQRNVVGRESGW